MQFILDTAIPRCHAMNYRRWTMGVGGYDDVTGVQSV